MKKSKPDRNLGMLAVIRRRIFFFYFAIQNVKIKIYRTIILPVLYGCETWSLTLREECRLRGFENKVPEEDIWT